MITDPDSLVKFIRMNRPEKGEAFVVLPACGAVFIGAAATPFDGSNAETSEAAHCTYLQAHEFVHLTQVLSTRSYREHAADQLRVATRLEHARQNGQEVCADERAVMLEMLTTGAHRIKRRDIGYPSMGDIAETHAVIEGWKVSPYARHEFSLVFSILCNSHCLSMDYSGIIGHWMKRPELMLELLPRICWIALQDRDPASCYARLVTLPERVPKKMLHGMTTRNIAEVFEMAETVHDGIWNSFPSCMLPLWQDYMSELHRIADDDPTWDTLACPSLLEHRQGLMPSVFFFDDDVVRVDGPAARNGTGEEYKWVGVAELVSRNIGDLRGATDGLEC